MSTQIAVRLPDELVARLDERVAQGVASSRAELVTLALERHLRWLAACADAETMERVGPSDDLDPLIDWTVDQRSTRRWLGGRVWPSASPAWRSGQR